VTLGIGIRAEVVRSHMSGNIRVIDEIRLKGVDMVRENKESEVSPGVDPNKSVKLSDELRKEGKWTGDTADPESTTNLEPIDIRGDATPEKRG
jgi:hypothetical protein